MRTPVLLVGGQGDTDAVIDELVRQPGTLVLRHHFDGHVVCRTTRTVVRGVNLVTETPLELANGCASCTIRNDLLVLLRKLHRRADVTRIVLQLGRWLEPEPICWAIQRVPVTGMPGYIDGPAARDVEITAVIGCLDEQHWLEQALGDDELPDGRTVAQVAVGQAEFADLLLCRGTDPELQAVLRRLAPRATLIDDAGRLEAALQRLPASARRGRSDCPHDPLLAGRPPLTPDGRVFLMEYRARRPFHPGRLETAMDVLLDGVVRARGRVWLASNNTEAMWLETAGGGYRADSGGKWLAAMTDSEAAYVDPERRAMADLIWDRTHGDRHTSLTVLVCGADPDRVRLALDDALLSAGELRRGLPGLHDPFGDWSQETGRSFTAGLEERGTSEGQNRRTNTAGLEERKTAAAKPRSGSRCGWWRCPGLAGIGPPAGSDGSTAARTGASRP